MRTYQSPPVWRPLVSSAGCCCLWCLGGWCCWCAGVGGPAEKTRRKHLHAVEVFTQEEVVSSTPSSSPSSSTTVSYHKGLVQDVANDAFVHPVPSPQHAFGQICHRASVAELQQQHQRRGGRENISISQHLHLSQHNMAAPRLRTSGTSEICIGASGGEQKKKKKNFLMVRLQKDAQHNSARSAAAYLSPAA